MRLAVTSVHGRRVRSATAAGRVAEQVASVARTARAGLWGAQFRQGATERRCYASRRGQDGAVRPRRGGRRRRDDRRQARDHVGRRRTRTRPRQGPTSQGGPGSPLVAPLRRPAACEALVAGRSSAHTCAGTRSSRSSTWPRLRRVPSRQRTVRRVRGRRPWSPAKAWQYRAASCIQNARAANIDVTPTLEDIERLIPLGPAFGLTLVIRSVVRHAPQGPPVAHG